MIVLQVAHLLGSVHDGDPATLYLGGPGAAGCSWCEHCIIVLLYYCIVHIIVLCCRWEGFIMSNRRRDSRSQRWSACSLRQLRYFLTSGRGSCLANYPAPSAITLPGRRALPGHAISLDTQCFKVASREKS